MFRRFDPDTKLAVYHALRLANHRQRRSISPEDLLCGLTWRNHDHDCQFGQLKADANQLWADVGIPHLPLSATPFSVAHLPLDRRSKTIIRAMRVEADAGGQYWIDIDHMLLAMLTEDGPAGQSLRKAGWTRERIQSAAAYGRARYPQRKTPPTAPIHRFWDEHGRQVAAAVAIAIAAALLYLRLQN